MAHSVALLLLLAAATQSASHPNGIVTVSNTEPRRDVNGSLMDVHDGMVIQWTTGGRYYWYGMGYRNCTETDGLIPPFQCPGIYESFGRPRKKLSCGTLSIVS